MNEKNRALVRAVVTLVLVFSLTSEVDASNFTETRNNPTSFRQSPSLFANSLSSVSLQPAAAVSAGSNHTCALTTSGRVMCWGSNSGGQLGDGTLTDSSTPVDVSGLSSGVSTVSAGNSHTCALTQSGGVKCWGGNTFGQLGDAISYTYRRTPVDVSGLTSGVSTVVAGYDHTCALTTSGGVKCWGRNDYGQLGDGTTTNRFAPVDVSGLTSDVSAISAGYSHTCAVTTSGGVKCWGANWSGELGNGTSTNSLIPVDVSGLSSGVSTVSAGSSHTCVVTTSGGVKCWGRNDHGQLGDGTINNRSFPVDVSGLASGVSDVSAGMWYSCAVTTSNEVICWGSNDYGQLGEGSRTDHSTPMDVNDLASEVSVGSTGRGHTCVLTLSGGIKCWGDNSSGQLGDGTTTHQTTPVDVKGLTSGVSGISTSYNHSCAITTSGELKCWGGNHSGELGDGTSTDRSTPVDVIEFPSGVSMIATGTFHTCATFSSGGVKCWGRNNYGQLGDGTTSDRSTPGDVTELTSGVSMISAGGEHTCAITSSGGVKCWGWNYSGQLGDGSATDSQIPVDVNGLTSGVRGVSAGYSHTCALTSSGGVMCWGGNQRGELGNGTTISSYIPVDVNELNSGVISISAGNDHTCALTSSGGVKCWGANYIGQLGDGTTNQHTTPTDVLGLTSGVIAVSAGWSHTCAVTTTGGVKCWGGNDFGQLGNGTRIDSSTPIDVLGLTSGVIAVSAGWGHTCALTTTGGVKCWGANNTGQLGWKKLWVPVEVLGFGGGSGIYKVMLPFIQR